VDKGVGPVGHYAVDNLLAGPRSDQRIQLHQEGDQPGQVAADGGEDHTAPDDTALLVSVGYHESNDGDQQPEHGDHRECHILIHFRRVCLASWPNVKF